MHFKKSTPLSLAPPSIRRMRRHLLCIFGLLISADASANWEPITRTQDFILYASPLDRNYPTESVQLWEMKDYFRPQVTSTGKPYLSVKIQSEYNCVTHKTRFLTLVFYSENLGNGKVVSAFDKPLNWSSIAPGSVSDKLRFFACREKY